MNQEQKSEQPWRPEPRVVGGTEEEQQRAVEELMRVFREQPRPAHEQIRRALERFEYVKTAEEERAIAFANYVSNEIAVRYGGKAYDYPARNFHLVPPQVYKMVEGLGDLGSAAFMRQSDQAAFLDVSRVRQSRYRFWTVILEEMLHLKGYLSIEPEDGGFRTRRSGLGVRATVKDAKLNRQHEHFRGLEEAITTELVNRMKEKILQQPDLADDREWLESDEFSRMRSQIAKEINVPEREVDWVSRDGKEWWATGYHEARQVLAYVIEQIVKDNPGMDEESAFSLFANAKFSGDLRPMTRAVRKSFGRYGLRVLAMMEPDYSSAENALEFLWVLRADTLKEREKRQLRK